MKEHYKNEHVSIKVLMRSNLHQWSLDSARHPLNYPVESWGWGSSLPLTVFREEQKDIQQMS
jgi:hypothetical protein